MQKILIVEDDLGISNSLKIYLENSGFKVDVKNSGKDATETILENKYDLVILDINLPIKDGITICREVRLKSNIPIIMLTARSSELDKVTGLETGGDDYVSKPFSPRELLARINTILRRVSLNSKEAKIKDTLKIRDIEIDLNKAIVKKSGKVIPFTKNELEILKKLIKENGNIVDRKTFMKDVIGYNNYIFDRTIDTHIKNIRKKLAYKDLIITVRGKGYRLNVS